jgi:hypothetical protein
MPGSRIDLGRPAGAGQVAVPRDGESVAQPAGRRADDCGATRCELSGGGAFSRLFDRWLSVFLQVNEVLDAKIVDRPAE